ncbi:tyrosine-protein kinase TXK-like [Gigantopelta aegis]|uniref:tyrosine-protein kinase TXK-like n=1 Tax=Gigantopelta aegis TaxID=1735272 RepID=UPI001B8897D4|nr:tyrosine-protein kinase TXK-like [Gigantopelta aegis]
MSMRPDSKYSSPEPEIKVDCLLKRSVNKTTFTKENYKSRLFILDPNYLRYNDGKLQKRGKEKGRIPLETIKAVETVDDKMLDNKDNVFQIVYLENFDFYTLYIVTLNQEQRQSWIDAIRREALKCGARFNPKYHRGVWTKSLGKFNCCDQRDRGAIGCEVATPEIPDEPNDVSSYHRTPVKINHLPIPTPDPPSTPMTNGSKKPEKKIYIAIYDYTPAEDGDLELVQGEEYEIIDDSREHWWMAKGKKGKKGYIPANYVKKKFDLEIYDWYYKDLSRQRSEAILKEDAHEGCFLVRDSTSTPGMYTLSVFTNEGLVRHYHIRKNSQGQFYISDSHSFSSIPEVIYYHRHNSGGLITRLREPPHRNGKPSTAGFGHSKWEIAAHELEVMEVLGSGCFGSVHKGIWRGMPVAVKSMKENAMSIESFIEEARTMTQLHHPNLVQLYGVVNKKDCFYIVAELMKCGALNTYLQRHKSRLLSRTSQLLDYCLQICSGMYYLEKHKFIHRDLAARNCLVGEKSVVKVADFGLARYVIDDEYTSSAGTKFPVKWAPPEVLSYTRFSSKSDVWAFGILMWEIFSGGDMPYSGMRNIEVVDFVINNRRRLPKPEYCPEKVYQILTLCWQMDPEKRPSFKELVDIVSGLTDGGNYPTIF